MSNPPKLIWDPLAKQAVSPTLELKNPVYSYFPQELVDLQIEVHKHPALLQILHDQPEKDVFIQLMEIATYCKVVVHGDYTQDEILGLCRLLIQKLQQDRTIIVLPN
jgi:hypothetical protein